MLMHRRISRVFNLVIVVCMVCLVFLFLQRPQVDLDDSNVDAIVMAARHKSFDEVESIGQIAKPSSGAVDMPENRITASALLRNDSSASVTGDLDSWATQLRQVANAKWDGDGRSERRASGGGNITGRHIVDSVVFLNEHFATLNTDRFGPIETAKTVIVIQVHSRLEYLRYLVETLSRARGIEETLLVFSHDIHIEAINHVVRNISFARVIQIFYPYNMQLFPHVFPGQDPRDCPEKITKEKAEETKCFNWQHPDKYGHFRVAKFTQIKHHWWWKMNYVFDRIVGRHGLNGWVLLLEEDHYVSPDFLHVLDKIVEQREEFCSACELISLGFYLKSYATYGTNIDRLGVHPWFSSKHNMGMALRADTWAKIKNCSQLFCTWDDYNWDWSLLQISVKCLPERFRVIFTKAPRVLHVGDCGVHTHRCGAHNAAAAAAKLFEEHKDRLFPQTLRVTEISRRTLKPSKENGGWGDRRDHELCLWNTRPLRPLPEGDKHPPRDSPEGEASQGVAVLADLLAAPVETVGKSWQLGGVPASSLATPGA